MKIQLQSDLHLEYEGTGLRRRFYIQTTGADVIVLAGDIATGIDGLLWAIDESERLGKPIIYVAGNHEYYSHALESLLPALRATAAGTNVHFLEKDSITLDGVRFLGCTLWTDYTADPNSTPLEAMNACEHAIRDHEVIKLNEMASFLPQHALELHKASRAWLANELDGGFNGKTVIVTHHAPSPSAQNPRFPISTLSGAFHSNLEALMGGDRVAAWLYGHTHYCIDTMVNGTRLITNQRGYPNEDTGRYDPHLVIDI